LFPTELVLCLIKHRKSFIDKYLYKADLEEKGKGHLTFINESNNNNENIDKQNNNNDLNDESLQDKFVDYVDRD